MKEYDVIVIGSGAGLDILDVAVEHGLKSALIDKGPAGGTCLNVGCIPSKMLIFPADRITEIREAAKLGIAAEIKYIDFGVIMRRMHKVVDTDRKQIKKYLSESKELDFYDETAEFIGEYMLKVGSETIKASQIYIATGTRPDIPPLQGLGKVDYLTNETLLKLTALPKSLVIIGGGYIGMEYAHFFEAMATEVTVLEMGPRLLPAEEPEISATLQRALARRMTIHTHSVAESVEQTPDGIVITFKHLATGQVSRLKAEKLLMATGRRSNADLLRVEKCGIKKDKHGFIRVNSQMETNKKGIYAIGDANGIEAFTHTAHAEAAVAAANGIHGQRKRMNYHASPHAVFTHPQVASVGLTEEEAVKKYKIMVGRADFGDTALGTAMMEDEGFVKIILEQTSGKILGGHIIGPWASVLIQEIVNAMASGGGRDGIASGIHIHPALSEVVIKALFNVNSVA
ncbi:hypothetical protein DGWBC_0646 [Dehalogenimonas sp. WBC-2]|nr:hypothetical protein DGWBC_0646 [Dehalogenimonas sp. WBC-2]